MEKVVKVLKISIIGVAILAFLIPLVPAPESLIEGTRLYEDNDEILGLETSYFVLTKNGTLVGWGGSSSQSLSSMFKSTRPYIFRKVIARDVAEFTCGTNLSMYVDKNHTLWGWGANEWLLLADDETITAASAVKVMDDVMSVALGREHALAIKTDGTLWSWGRNTHGQLGNGTTGEKDGMVIDGRKICEPQQIMDNVKFIRVVDDISFAITNNNELYMWGNSVVCAPQKIAEGVQDINHAYIGKSATWFQYLSTAGDVYLFDLREQISKEPFVRNVSSICRMGLVKDDGSLWRWEIEGDEMVLTKECGNVVTAADTAFYLTTDGNIYSDSIPQWLPSVPHSPLNAVPLLRNVVLVLLIALATIRHYEKRQRALTNNGEN